jgi:hypothetical protein
MLGGEDGRRAGRVAAEIWPAPFVRCRQRGDHQRQRRGSQVLADRAVIFVVVGMRGVGLRQFGLARCRLRIGVRMRVGYVRRCATVSRRMIVAVCVMFGRTVLVRAMVMQKRMPAGHEHRQHGVAHGQGDRQAFAGKFRHGRDKKRHSVRSVCPGDTPYLGPTGRFDLSHFLAEVPPESGSVLILCSGRRNGQLAYFVSQDHEGQLARSPDTRQHRIRTLLRPPAATVEIAPQLQRRD